MSQQNTQSKRSLNKKLLKSISNQTLKKKKKKKPFKIHKKLLNVSFN